MQLIIAKGVFKDIYHWGEGFVSVGANAKWNAFWARQCDNGGCFWRTYIHDGTPYAEYREECTDDGEVVSEKHGFKDFGDWHSASEIYGGCGKVADMM